MIQIFIKYSQKFGKISVYHLYLKINSSADNFNIILTVIGIFTFYFSFIQQLPFFKSTAFVLYQSRKELGGEGSDLPIFANSETAAVLESLEGLFYGLTWWSDWKVSKTYFMGQNWPQKSQNCPKSISREPLYKVSYPLKMTARHGLLSVVWDVYTSQTTGSSLKYYFFVFFGPYNDENVWFHVPREPLVV